MSFDPTRAQIATERLVIALSDTSAHPLAPAQPPKAYLAWVGVASTGGGGAQLTCHRCKTVENRMQACGGDGVINFLEHHSYCLPDGSRLPNPLEYDDEDDEDEDEEYWQGGD